MLHIINLMSIRGGVAPAWLFYFAQVFVVIRKPAVVQVGYITPFQWFSVYLNLIMYNLYCWELLPII